MASADFDGDGDPDLAWADAGTNYFSLMENAGMGQALLVASHDTGSVLRYSTRTRRFIDTFVPPGDAVAGARPAAPSLLVNGGFETPDAGGDMVGYDHASVPSGFGWAIDAGTIDHIGGAWQPAEGRQSIDLNGTSAAALSQPVRT